MQGADEIRAILAAYRDLAAVWRDLPAVSPERAAGWATATESALRTELAEYVSRTSAPSCGTRMFWKVGSDLTFGGCNAHFAKDASFSRAEDVVGITDLDRRLPWRNQGAKYRADDKAVVASGRANLEIIERQNRGDGTVVWVRAAKVPIRLANGQVMGLLGAYEEIDDQRGVKMFADALRKGKAAS